MRCRTPILNNLNGKDADLSPTKIKASFVSKAARELAAFAKWVHQSDLVVIQKTLQELRK